MRWICREHYEDDLWAALKTLCSPQLALFGICIMNFAAALLNTGEISGSWYWRPESDVVRILAALAWCSSLRWAWTLADMVAHDIPHPTQQADANAFMILPALLTLPTACGGFILVIEEALAIPPLWRQWPTDFTSLFGALTLGTFILGHIWEPAHERSRARLATRADASECLRVRNALEFYNGPLDFLACASTVAALLLLVWTCRTLSATRLWALDGPAGVLIIRFSTVGACVCATVLTNLCTTVSEHRLTADRRLTDLRYAADSSTRVVESPPAIPVRPRAPELVDTRLIAVVPVDLPEGGHMTLCVLRCADSGAHVGIDLDHWLADPGHNLIHPYEPGCHLQTLPLPTSLPPERRVQESVRHRHLTFRKS